MTTLYLSMIGLACLPFVALIGMGLEKMGVTIEANDS